MKRFRPSIVPTIFVIIGLIILLNLGFWQLRRNDERKAHYGSITMRLDAEPATGAELASEPVEEMYWRKANLHGRFVDAGPWYFAGRFEFGEPGYDVLQPFLTDEGTELLVNRGWIPTTDWSSIVAEADPGSDAVHIRGLLLEPLGDDVVEPLRTLEGAPERFPRDSYAGLRTRVLPDSPPIVLIAGQQYEAGVLKSRDAYPVSGYVPKPKELPHLQYAITWFLIAGTLIVIWGVTAFKAEPDLPTTTP